MPDSYPALIELISRLEGTDKKTCETALYCLNAADRRDSRLRSKTEAVVADNETLRSALKLILSCPAKSEDVPSNKLKIIVPEYVYFEVVSMLEASCKAAALKETEK